MRERVYIVGFENVTLGTAVQDLFAIKAGASSPIELHHIHLEAVASAAAQLRMRLKRATATVTLGSGGSSYTPVALDPNDAAAVATAHINDTSQATTSGAFTTLEGFQWDVVLPFDYMPAPEDRIKALVSGGLVFDLPAVITATVVSGFFKFSEA